MLFGTLRPSCPVCASPALGLASGPLSPVCTHLCPGQESLCPSLCLSPGWEPRAPSMSPTSRPSITAAPAPSAKAHTLGVCSLLSPLTKVLMHLGTHGGCDQGHGAPHCLWLGRCQTMSCRGEGVSSPAFSTGIAFLCCSTGAGGDLRPGAATMVSAWGT